jgi:hypothetical protein
MTNAGARRRRRLAATAALLCALLASLAVAAPALAEAGDSAEIRPLSDGGFSFPDITGPAAPEEYPFQLEPSGPEIRARQVNDQEVIGEYIEGGFTAWTIEAGPAHDAVGATVPTTVTLTEDDEGGVVTLIVHYRAGNPGAGGAAFVFPIVGGQGWEGGYRTGRGELNEPNSSSISPPTSSSTPGPTCKVPSLRGLSLRAARTRLRADHCAIGQVRLGAGATRGKGKVVRQFHPAGAQLAAGAPIAVKLGPRG